jgi:hypothetical protein
MPEIPTKTEVAEEAASVVGARRLRIIADGDPDHTKIIDLTTGQDLTELYSFGQVTVCATSRGITATLVVCGVEADVVGLLDEVRTDGTQKRIVDAVDAIVSGSVYNAEA